MRFFTSGVVGVMENRDGRGRDSKEEKDLWKCLTNFAFNSSHLSKLNKFRKFVSWVLFSRDDSISLLSLDFKRHGLVEPKLLNRVMKYASMHNVQKLTINTKLSFRTKFEFPPTSLAVLKLSINCDV